MRATVSSVDHDQKAVAPPEPALRQPRAAYLSFAKRIEK